jgi:DNA replication and repair protein RecF
LREKQHILKNAQSEPENFGLLPVINNSLAEVGADVVFFRASYLARLEEAAADYQKQASAGHEALTLQYVSHGLPPEQNSGRSLTREEIAASLAAHQSLRYDAEVASGRVLSGAARDDYTARLDGTPAKGFASQGQTRTIALCLKLSERDIAAGVLGAPPILLLDDVLSELDGARREFVLENTGGGQVIITTAGSDVFSRNAAVIHARSGSFASAQ